MGDGRLVATRRAGVLKLTEAYALAAVEHALRATQQLLHARFAFAFRLRLTLRVSEEGSERERERRRRRRRRRRMHIKLDRT